MVDLKGADEAAKSRFDEVAAVAQPKVMNFAVDGQLQPSPVKFHRRGADQIGRIVDLDAPVAFALLPVQFDAEDIAVALDHVGDLPR